MSKRRYFFSTFAECCLAGDWQTADLALRMEYTLGEQSPWLKSYAQRLRKKFIEAPSHAVLVEFLCADDVLARIRQRYQPRIRRYLLNGAPFDSASEKPLYPAVPQLHSPLDLAQWIGLDAADLEWFADRSNQSARSPISKVRHYHVTTLAKRSGGRRLLEIPKARLKFIQRRIHDQILVHLPLHSAAFGFVAERPTLQHARLHVGQAVVLRFDLSDCFLHVHGGHVFRAFRSLGYSDFVSRDLLGLCTHRVSLAQVKGLGLSEHQQQLAQQNHLPQGAPSSPLLSHFALAGMDRRLSAYAARLDAKYSRYADDLVISGGVQLQQQFRQIEARVGAIVREEGFTLNMRKSRCMSASQQQRVTGISVNQHLNIPRKDFDNLKAELYNCVHKGWRSQNHTGVEDYPAHLRGRLQWCQQRNPARAEKLLRLYERIDWQEENPLIPPSG